MKLEVKQTARLIHVRAVDVGDLASLTLAFGFVRAEQVAHTAFLVLNFTGREKAQTLLRSGMSLLFHLYSFSDQAIRRNGEFFGTRDRMVVWNGRL